MTKTIVFSLLLSMLAWLSCERPAPNTQFLSSLAVKKGDPLYLTYAAAMERSTYLLDEGYELRPFEANEPLRFHTDTGGELSLGFRVDGQWIYQMEAYFKAPEIRVSYPDMVRFSAWPVEGLRLDCTFMVYSSQKAVWEIEMINEGRDPLEFSLVPLFSHTLRPFHHWSRTDNRGFSFLHESFPDGWTLNQGLPHVDSIKNIFELDQEADSLFVLQSNHPSGAYPFDVFPEGADQLQLTGRTFSPSGERLMHRLNLQAFLADNLDYLITEDSPVKGLPQPGIDLDGYRRTELSWLPGAAPGKAFVLNIMDPLTGFGTTLEGSCDKRRTDLSLGKANFLPPPTRVNWSGRNFERLEWTAVEGAVHYLLFQRTYPNAVYERVGETRDPFFEVPASEGAEIKGFLVLAVAKNGTMGMHSSEILNREAYTLDDFTEGVSPIKESDVISGMGMVKKMRLKGGEKQSLKLSRTVAPLTDQKAPIYNGMAETVERDALLSANEALFATVPQLNHPDPEVQLLYYSAWNMLRQVFYPAEGKSSYNYYVFSREPTWGWGHGGQVFHESMTMLSYVYMDPLSAMNSQRVYAERQYDNGYINYRTGSYLDEIIEYDGKLTSSAPWYNWINAELFKTTRDTAFLREMYASGKAFYQFYTQNRDKDGDGLCEWGGHAVLESVRDAAVAVWDEVGWPAEFEGVDVNSMLVMEARALEFMARQLGLEGEAAAWKQDYEKRAVLINQVFWDAETGFYYNADRLDNDFTYKNPDDLKRMEIIGFLPLWAGIADSLTAKRVIEAQLLDEDKFWRKYGVPTLSAEDSYYNHKGYWNGPVWVEWNLFIVEALLNYGYEKEARQLVDKLAQSMIIQLKANNNLWEFYSPDEAWAGYHKTYIWAAIINRMLLDAFGTQP